MVQTSKPFDQTTEQAPIFILGCHKSGTSLLRSLLDGHPELSVIPVESHMLRHCGFACSYPLTRQRSQTVSVQSICNRLTGWIEQCNTVDDPFCDHKTRSKWDVERFRKKLVELVPKEKFSLDLKSIFGAFVEAVNHSLFRETSGQRFVEKSVDHMEHALFLQSIYPDAVFLHVLRNPYANLVSLRRYKSMGGRYPRMTFLVKSIRQSFKFARQNSRELKNYRVVRYEDLVERPEESMRRVCESAKIDFLPCLLTPTELGKLWTGNSISGQSFTGVDPMRLSVWRTSINGFENRLTNVCLRMFFQPFGYQTEDIRGRPMKRVEGEWWRTYCVNRAFLITAITLRALVK